jgi:hypothetical protein
MLDHKNLLGKNKKSEKREISTNLSWFMAKEAFLNLRNSIRKINPEASEKNKLVSRVEVKQSTPSTLKNCAGSKKSGPHDVYVPNSARFGKP